jgi:hypothetical protein
MPAVYETLSLVYRGTEYPVNLQHVDANRSTDDVHNGVDGSHLMKMDLAEQRSVYGGLRLGDFSKNRYGQFLCLFTDVA